MIAKAIEGAAWQYGCADAEEFASQDPKLHDMTLKAIRDQLALRQPHEPEVVNET